MNLSGAPVSGDSTTLPEGQGWLRGSVWPLALLLFALAMIAVLTNAPGEYVRDNRFEFFWTPGKLLSRYSSIWDPVRGWVTSVGTSG